MSEPTPDPDDLRERLAHLLHQTDDLPAGRSKCETLERAVRTADGAGLVELGVAARLILINAYREIRRYDLMLTPFAWLRSAERRAPEAFDPWAVHQFSWMHKWLPTGLLGDPRFTLAQIAALVDQLEERYRLHGYSPHPVHDKRRALAHHIGDTAAADAHFAAWRAAEPDDMSDCPACVVDSQVGYFVARGRFEDAIAVARPVLDAPSECAEQPHGVLTSLLEAYLATGRLAEAARAHLLAYRVVRGTPQGKSALHAHLRFCAVTGNGPRGLEILADNLDVLTDPPSPKVGQDFAAAAALLLSRLPDRETLSFALGERRMDGEALRAHCVATALATAAEFDRRNGTNAVSGRVAATLALADAEPVLVAVPATAAVKPAAATPAPEPPGDPVEVARRTCAALDDGELFTGARLLATLPADLDAVLPDGLAARLAVHRVWLVQRGAPAELAEALLPLLDRLAAAGEDAATVRLHAFLAELLDAAEETDRAAAHAELARLGAARLDDPVATLRGHLAAADLLVRSDVAAAHAEVDAAEWIAAERAPRRLGAVGNTRAEIHGHAGELEAALAIVAELETGPWPESTRLAVSGHHARLLANLGRVTESLAQFDRFVALARTYPGPWVAEALMQYASLVDQAGIAGEHLPVLLDAVAEARTHLPPGGVAQACLHLSAGYLATGRDLEAAETLEEALRLMPADYTEAVSDIRYRLALACRNLEEHEIAAAHFAAVAASSADDDHGLRGHLLFQLGDSRLRLGEYAEAAAAFRASADNWLAADTPVAASESLVKLAHATGLDDLAAGMAALEEAGALVADDSVAGALDQLADVVGFRVALLAHHERFTEALSMNQLAEEYAVCLGNSDWHAFLASRAARLRLDLDDPAGAESDARRAAALVTEESDAAVAGAILGTLARTLEEQGKPVDTDPVIRSLTTRLDR
ncbi:hypothetical protein [Actinokineospora iranica]|uniref:Uncharacterized protein n=1 Tax=Actinokineospora iranica TaxID=1271860 RepID=A0A1G6JC40_9PSEU|nr:hypothetical protein [Actinokineospora iranica]SDC16260.1 hypothetical protein SAMN05216174_101335 [Actinokineospora iranica]